MARALALQLGFHDGLGHPTAPTAPKSEGGNPDKKTIGIAAIGVTDDNVGPTSWIFDSGSTFDLVGTEDIPNIFRGSSKKLSQPVKLNAANGTIKVDSSIQLQVGSIQVVVDALVLPKTPPVISMGKKCMVEGYGFHWSHSVILPSSLTLKGGNSTSP